MIIELLQHEMLKLGYREYILCAEISLGQRTSITYQVGGIGSPNHKRHRRRCHIWLHQCLTVS